MVGLEYYRSGFFQEKCRAIEAAVEEYAQARSLLGADPEKLAAIKSRAEELLARLTVESGLREERESFLAVDREFLLESGELDRVRLNNFSKAVLSAYALEQIKWTFAATEACLTPITRRTLEEAGIGFEDLLPLELRRRRRKDLQSRHRSRRPNTDTFFVYPDGRVLGTYLREAARLTYAELRDRTGFDWRCGYSPGKGVRRDGWLAGFNERGEWERIDFERYLPLVKELPIDELLRFFTGAFQPGADELHLISLPQLDEALLFDTRSRLMRDDERRYYSLSGELYAVRSVDRPASLEAARSRLAQLGVKKLTGIVASDDSEDTQAFYRRAFSGFVTASTRIYSRSDPEVAEKLTRLRDEAAATDISRALTVQLFRLVREGRTAQEVYEGLTPSDVRQEYRIKLRLFSNPLDLELFLAQPEIEAVLDREAAELIRGLKVPEERQEQLSNAVQNLLLNYDSVLRSSDISPAELIRLARQVLVEGGAEEAGRISVTGAKQLQAIMQAAALPVARVVVPAFRPITTEDYFDLFAEDELVRWAESPPGKQMPARFLPGFRKLIAEAKVPEARRKDYSRGMQRTMALYREISQSTHLDALEIVEIFNDVFLKGASKKASAQAKVYVACSLEALIREASAGNANRVRRLLKDIYSIPPAVGPAPGPEEPAPASEAGLPPRGLNLFRPKDLELLAAGPQIRALGLEEKRLADLLALHRRSYRGTERRYVRRIPLHLKSDGSGEHFPLSIEIERGQRRIHDVGWIVDYHAGEPEAIGYTELGWQTLPEEVKQEIDRVFRGTLAAKQPQQMPAPAWVTRTEEILVKPELEPAAETLFVPRVSVVQLKAASQAAKPAEMEFAHPFQALRKRLEELRAQAGGRSPARAAPESRMSQDVPAWSDVQSESPQAAVSIRRPREPASPAAGAALPAAGTPPRSAAEPAPSAGRTSKPAAKAGKQAAPAAGEPIEQHYREDKEKLAELKERRASERKVQFRREQVQRVADDLFTRVVEKLEAPADPGPGSEARDALFERFITRMGGGL